MKLHRHTILILAILFLGLILRIYNLGGESLWLDEGISITRAKLNLLQIGEGLSSNVHPPFYFFTLHYWINLFGDSEISTRLLSVISGVLSLFMIYKTGSLIHNRETGILSSLLLALSVFHINYSQTVRGYSLMTLLALLSIFFFIKLLVNVNRVNSVGYIISSSLLIYTHYFGVFIIMAQNIYIFTMFILSKDEYGINLKRWVLLQCALAVIYLPWILILKSPALKFQNAFVTDWIPLPTINSIINSFTEYSGTRLLFFVFLIFSLSPMLPLKKLMNKINLKNPFISNKDCSVDKSLSIYGRNYFLLLWLLTPIIIPFVISQFSRPIYHTRYTIAGSLAFYILIAIGIQSLSNRYFKSVIIIFIAVAALGNINEYYLKVDKPQWRESAAFVDKNAHRGDLVLFIPGVTTINLFDYYSMRTDLNKKSFPPNWKKIDEENVKKLGSTVETFDRVWLILSYNFDDQGLTRKTLTELGYNLLNHKKYILIGIYQFEKIYKNEMMQNQYRIRS